MAAPITEVLATLGGSAGLIALGHRVVQAVRDWRANRAKELVAREAAKAAEAAVQEAAEARAAAEAETLAVEVERDTILAPTLLEKLETLRRETDLLRERADNCDEQNQARAAAEAECKQGLEAERRRGALRDETIKTIAEKALAARGGEDDTLVRIITRLRAEVSAVDAFRVLIVDDDPQQRRVMTQVVERLGHHATCVASAFDALDTISRERVDVVLTDLLMPAYSGEELIESLRRAKQKVPVVLVSGDTTALARIAKDGQLTLSKPFKPTELAEVLSKARATAA